MIAAAPFLLLALMAGISWSAGRRFEAERLPMQWDFKGRPTWYAPRRVALWFPVGVAFGLMTFAVSIADAGERGWLTILMGITALGTQLLHLFLLNRWQSQMN